MRMRDLQRACIKAIKQVQKAERDIDNLDRTYIKKYENELNNIGESVITEWYSKYPDRKYNPTGSLYSAFRVVVKGLSFRVDFDSDLMNEFKHHQSNEIIFNNSFLAGYHGGSFGRNCPGGDFSEEWVDYPMDRPYYRTGVGFPFWGKKAKKSYSPYRLMVKLMNEKIEEIKEDKQKKVDSVIDDVRQSVYSVMDLL